MRKNVLFGGRIFALLFLLCMFFAGTQSVYAASNVWGQWQTAISEDKTYENSFIASAQNTFSVELWHYSGGYWGNNFVRIYDKQVFDDPDNIYDTGSDGIIHPSQIKNNLGHLQSDLNIYVDGETGTNFQRDGFQRMMYDIYNGKINCIVVKDLSRFGREYIEMGDYIEKVFPLLGIRFIAVNDRVDNEAAPLDISVPIKNVINSMYSRDLSKKSASALRLKQLNGEFIGGPAPFGYVKLKEDKHILIVDPEAAIQNALHSTEIKTEAADIKKQIDQALANIVFIKSIR